MLNALQGTLPNEAKLPSIQVCAFKLLPYNSDAFNEKDQTSRLFGLEVELNQHNIILVSLRSNISKIELNLTDNPVWVSCPRIPHDLDARVGYRRSKYNPNKKERVFGYQVIISTSIEPETGLELPIACITKPRDGNYFIHLKEQIKWQHPSLKTYLDIGGVYDMKFIGNDVFFFGHRYDAVEDVFKTLWPESIAESRHREMVRRSFVNF